MKLLLLLALVQWACSRPVPGDFISDVADSASRVLLKGAIIGVTRIGSYEDLKFWENVIPKMKDSSVLFSSESIDSLLVHPVIEVKRNVEMLRVVADIEQEKSFVIRNPLGNDIGTAVENTMGLIDSLSRQIFTVSRTFLATVKDSTGKVALKVNSILL